jgi:hypothetical protein
MSFKDPIQITFRSRIDRGRFYQLGYDKEVSLPWYSKYITDLNQLSREEMESMVINYTRIQRDLGGIIMQLQSIKP